jgi:hypothetical protein
MFGRKRFGLHFDGGLGHAVDGTAGDRRLRRARRDVDDAPRKVHRPETRAGKRRSKRAARQR